MFKMEISAEKTKPMTNSANDIQREIKVKGQKLGTVTSFKYLGAVVSDDGTKPEVLLRIAQATAALTKLKPIWRDNNISLGSKMKRSLVISIFLYACGSWTLTAELEKRTQAFEMRCYRRLLNTDTFIGCFRRKCRGICHSPVVVSVGGVVVVQKL